MNKTESVSIGRKAFICDVDAYEAIKAYLDRSKKKLSHDPDQEEILTDLEQAMAGHLSDMSGNTVVDKGTAQKVIEMLGEISTADAKSEAVDDAPETPVSFGERLGLIFKETPKKDRSRAILEGVCAGFAKLLLIDPFWVRLAFIGFVIISQGFGIIVYLILALIMKDEDDYAGKTAGEVVGAVKDRAKMGFESGAKRYEQILARIIRKGIKVLVAVFDVLLLLALIAIGALWSIVIFFMVTNPNRVVLFGEQPTLLDFAALISIGAVILIPILLLIMQLAGSHFVRNVRANVIFGCLWVLSLLLAVGSAVNVVPNVRDRLVRDTPMTKNVVVEAAGDQIVHSCFTLWGDCRSDRPEVFTTSICGRDVSMIETSDQDMMRMQNWSWHFQTDSLAYPMTESGYCDFVKTTLNRHDPGRVVFAAQEWNDEDYVQEMAVSDGVCTPSNAGESNAASNEHPAMESGNMMGARESGLNGSATTPACAPSAPTKTWLAEYYIR